MWEPGIITTPDYELIRNHLISDIERSIKPNRKKVRVKNIIKAFKHVLRKDQTNADTMLSHVHRKICPDNFSPWELFCQWRN